jgi:hypothetical protein
MSGLRRTRKTTGKIAEQLLGLGIEVSANTVARLWNEMGFSLKTNRKNIESGVQHKPGHRARRNRQFLTIKSTRHRFKRAKQPVISVDGKKREMIGLFKNNGRAWREKLKQVNDHDFRTDAIGVALPYGTMMSVATPAWSWSAPLERPSPLRSMPLTDGGATGAARTIPTPSGCSSLPTPAAPTALDPGCGNAICSRKFAIAMD